MMKFLPKIRNQFRTWGINEKISKPILLTKFIHIWRQSWSLDKNQFKIFWITGKNQSPTLKYFKNLKRLKNKLSRGSI